jgi:hypothetical protein
MGDPAFGRDFGAIFARNREGCAAITLKPREENVNAREGRISGFEEIFVGRPVALLVLASVLVSVPEAARADDEPLSWRDGTVTYRDWGLYRPGVPVLIERPYRCCYGYDGRVISKNEGGPTYYPSNAHDPYYFPSNRGDPDAYRMKPPVRPVPAEPFYRSWGAGSDPNPAPASQPSPYDVPVEGPTVIYAPKEREHKPPQPEHRPR